MGQRGGEAGASGTGDLASVRDDHGCFGCGRLNLHGLRLRFVQEGDGVRAPFTPRLVDEGYGGVVHGGIVATLLDEAMAWACSALPSATLRSKNARPSLWEKRIWVMAAMWRAWFS